ncbi:hypothetical protein ACFVMC_23190 [Nocardia sp. NPDC127579]|uniref:hypothetical protein n=1 Tax=Nocardia sp. NPDC127579 TaxID=3345402 RepID=UPI003637B0B1
MSKQPRALVWDSVVFVLLIGGAVVLAVRDETAPWWWGVLILAAVVWAAGLYSRWRRLRSGPPE